MPEGLKLACDRDVKVQLVELAFFVQLPSFTSVVKGREIQDLVRGVGEWIRSIIKNAKISVSGPIH